MIVILFASLTQLREKQDQITYLKMQLEERKEVSLLQ